ncbi:MAG: hypothetical protein V3U88_01740 [Methylococcales bacterium]
MQVAKFEDSLYTRLIYVMGSAEAVSSSGDVFIDVGDDYFQQFQQDLVIIFTIKTLSGLELEVRLDETVPSDTDILLSMQMPFVVKGDEVTPEGDRGALIVLGNICPTVAIPKGDYLLTVYQTFTGEYPLSGHSENVSDEDKLWDPDVPILMRMYFNSVDSAEGIAAKSHWHPSKEFGR